MARRSSRLPRRPPLRLVRWLLALQLGVALLLGGWYLAQPDARQGDLRRLAGNVFDPAKRVTALEALEDVWQLYFTDSAVGATARGDQPHVYGGAPLPVPGPGAPDCRVLANAGYVVGYSETLANPLWAAYRVRDLTPLPEPGARPERFATDRRTTTRVAPDDYARSGYDRGHLAPNYAIATRYGPEAQRETFLMSNITPQLHALNAGLWRDLEHRIATNYAARYGEVWVLTGPVFGAAPAKIRGRIAVPEAFFLIVIDEVEGRLRTLALLVPQTAPPGADPARFLTSIDEIQRRTGLDFLRDLDDAAERQVEARRADRVW